MEIVAVTKVVHQVSRLQCKIDGDCRRAVARESVRSVLIRHELWIRQLELVDDLLEGEPAAVGWLSRDELARIESLARRGNPTDFAHMGPRVRRWVRHVEGLALETVCQKHPRRYPCLLLPIAALLKQHGPAVLLEAVQGRYGSPGQDPVLLALRTDPLCDGLRPACVVQSPLDQLIMSCADPIADHLQSLAPSGHLTSSHTDAVSEILRRHGLLAKVSRRSGRPKSSEKEPERDSRINAAIRAKRGERSNQSWDELAEVYDTGLTGNALQKRASRLKQQEQSVTTLV